MNTKVTIVNDQLVVEPLGLDKLWGLRRRITVPLGQVRGASHDPGVKHVPRGIRAPGLALPGLKWVGTFHKGGERSYWNVRAGRETVVVELSGNRLARLYLTVGDARAVVDSINAAVPA